MVVLLVLPVAALWRLRQDWLWLAGYVIAVNVIAWLAFRNDKRRAEQQDWRVPENTLHLLEIAGGWPAAFFAQRYFRHKTSKLSYQFVFWLIVLTHEYAALDSMHNWRYTKRALQMTSRSAVLPAQQNPLELRSFMVNFEAHERMDCRVYPTAESGA